MKNAITLGNTCREITTDIEGVAVSKTEYMTGNVQFVLQQKPKADGAFIEPVGYDAHQLDYVNAGIAARVTAAPTDTGIVLGQKVRDLVTDFAGIAVRKTTFMNGCIYYTVQGKIDDKDVAREDFLEYKRLKVVSQGVVAEIAKRVEKSGPTATPPGGPVTRPMKRG